MEYENKNKIEETNFNLGELDFEKMNRTLADPTFANWYSNNYHTFVEGENNISMIPNFVSLVKEHSNKNDQ